MGDLSTDVARVRSAEALLVVVPSEGVFHCPTEASHVQTVLVILILSAAMVMEEKKGEMRGGNFAFSISVS